MLSESQGQCDLWFCIMDKKCLSSWPKRTERNMVKILVGSLVTDQFLGVFAKL
jgi:hypothetical protein